MRHSRACSFISSVSASQKQTSLVVLAGGNTGKLNEIGRSPTHLRLSEEALLPLLVGPAAS